MSTDSATIPVRRFTNSDHAERMVAHLTKTVERIGASERLLRHLTGEPGNLYVTAVLYRGKTHLVETHTGPQALFSATRAAEDCEANDGAGGEPRADYLGCIVIRGDGTWAPVELFPEHGK